MLEGSWVGFGVWGWRVGCILGSIVRKLKIESFLGVVVKLGFSRYDNYNIVYFNRIEIER